MYYKKKKWPDNSQNLYPKNCLCFFKDWPGWGQTWDFSVFVYFLFRLLRLRPLGYCAPTPKKIYVCCLVCLLHLFGSAKSSYCQLVSSSLKRKSNKRLLWSIEKSDRKSNLFVQSPNALMDFYMTWFAPCHSNLLYRVAVFLFLLWL